MACFFSVCGPAAAKETRIVMATSGVGGAFYPLGGGMCRLITKYAPNITATAQMTGGVIANIRLVDTEACEIGMMVPVGMYKAFHGLPPFKKKYPDFCDLVGLYPPLTNLVVLRESGINTWYDLKGRKIGIGPPGSVSAEIFLDIVRIHPGLDPKDIKIKRHGYSDMIQAVKDGELEGCFHDVPAGTSGLMDLSTFRKVKWIPVDPETTAKVIKKFPYFYESKLPAGSYKGQDQDVPALAIAAGLFCRKELDENVVYECVKAIVEHMDELAKVHAVGKKISKATAVDGIGGIYPIHPGAIRYYKEINHPKLK